MSFARIFAERSLITTSKAEDIKKTNFIVFKPRTKSLTDVPNVLIDG